MNALLIFAKYPEPGQVKTRLGKHVGDEAAAELYKLFLEQTFVLTAEVSATCFVTMEPESQMTQFAEYVPKGYEIFPQKGRSLGERLIHAFDFVFAQGATKVIALGSDSPTLPREFIVEGFESLEHSEVVIGPAEDGGYYLIGIKQPQKSLFEKINWSTDSVLQTTLERVKTLEMKYCLLQPWYDVDDLESLRRAAADDPTGEIESCLRALKQVDFFRA